MEIRFTCTRICFFHIIKLIEKKGGDYLEIIKINDTAIKITLLPSEAKEYEISDITMGDESDIKGSFARLLKVAKEKVGFNFSSKKILAEIFPSKDGGYEIFISHTKRENQMYREKGEAPYQRPKYQLIYSVDNIDTLLLILSRLKCISRDIYSSAYYDEEGEKYYLILEDVSKKDLFLGFLGEFASSVRPSYIKYVEEYYKCISKSNAVTDLSSLL